MTNDLLSALIFIAGLVISTIIIYITTKLFGQKEGIGRHLSPLLLVHSSTLWYTTFLTMDSYLH
jgi:hypothetical protein